MNVTGDEAAEDGIGVHWMRTPPLLMHREGVGDGQTMRRGRGGRRLERDDPGHSEREPLRGTTQGKVKTGRVFTRLSVIQIFRLRLQHQLFPQIPANPGGMV